MNSSAKTAEDESSRVGMSLCLLALMLLVGGCRSFSSEKLASFFWENATDNIVQSTLDGWDVDSRAKDYKRHGANSEEARRNAEYDFIKKHNRFPR